MIRNGLAAIRVLIVGDVDSPAMRPARGSIETLVEAGSEARYAPAISHPLLQHSADSWFPDLLIVCQHWPDEYTEQDVGRLLTACPLARVICCFGPWCESDGRRRDIWPLAVRVPVRCVRDRIERELDVLAGIRRPLPLTASRDEIFHFEADGPIADRFASDWIPLQNAAGEAGALPRRQAGHSEPPPAVDPAA